MTRAKLLASAVSGLVMGSVVVMAQTRGYVAEGVTSPYLVINGATISCTSGGRPVIWIARNSLGDVGMTIPSGTGWTVIAYNPNALNQMPDRIKLFWLGHECGHAYLRTSDEEAADCWSARTGVRQGWFDADDADELADEMANNPGDSTHPPGPIRTNHVKACISGKAR